MKQTVRATLAVILVLATLLCVVACGEKVPAEGLWENATYRSDTTVGKGEKEVKIDIVAGDQSITVTVLTDLPNLGAALFAEGLTNDASFFDTLNGIKADWNADKAYWAFYKGDEYMQVGTNETVIEGGEHYRFVYTK